MQPPRSNMVVLVVNSSLGFALGLVVALQVYQLGLVIAGVAFERSPIWYPDRVEFAASGDDIAWSGGILLVLLLGWALASIYRGGTRYDGTRLAVLWVLLHCFRHGSAELLRVPFVSESDGALALASADLPAVLTWVMGVFGVAALLGIGLLAAPALQRFARHDLATKQARLVYTGAVGLVAWVAGAILVLVSLVPAGTPAVRSMLSWSGAFLLVTVVASPEPRRNEPIREPIRFASGTLILLGVLIVAARVFLADGLAVTL